MTAPVRRLRPTDGLRVASVGLRTRPLRAALSALGIAIGTAAIVLADEPTGNLDSTTGASIMELLRELNGGGATILMITHDTSLAEQLPRQIRMLDGQVVSDAQ